LHRSHRLDARPRRSTPAVVAVDMPKLTKRKTKRRWRRPESVTGPNVPLEIDDEIRAMKLQPRWSIDNALAFGRLALRIALEDAHFYEGRHARDEFKYWERTAAKGRVVEVALGQLLGQIGDSGLRTGIFLTRTRVSKSFAKSSIITLQLSPRLKPSGDAFTADDSRAEVARLAGARQLVREIATHATARCKQLERSSKINDRSADYGKQYFVLRIVEAWIWLTGKRPGLGNLPGKNPCLRFVEKALVDSGVDTEKSAWRALEASLKLLDRMEPETVDSINSIATQGPVWADKLPPTTKQPSGQG
jgi:hypothetical protein